MNIKKLILALILPFSFGLKGMQPVSGTVIDPLKHAGQFTVSIADSSLAHIPSGLTAASQQISQTGAHLFKNKGMPVLITTVAGAAPWWALATGTGYLMISQCTTLNPALFASMAAGASYATGEYTNSMIQKCIKNPYFKSAAQVALCAACLGLSYTGSMPLMNEAFFATAQAIGFQTLLESSAQLFAQKQSHPNRASSLSFLPFSSETKQAILDGTMHALSTTFPALCASNLYDQNAMLRILLYEQAYRLAQSGCAVAQQIISK